MLRNFLATVATATGLLALPLPLWASGAAALQDTGLLRITVTLIDADGASTPIPRVVMLVSDNPSTDDPPICTNARRSSV